MNPFVRQTLDKVRHFASTRDLARSGKLERVTARGKPVARQSFSAVSIRPGLVACDSVAHYAGRRVLEKDAPILPVSGCQQGTCSCRYVKLTDRRSGEDRRFPYACDRLTGMLESDNRQRADRRARRASAKPRAYFNNYD
jgi:hypothetical protein